MLYSKRSKGHGRQSLSLIAPGKIEFFLFVLTLIYTRKEQLSHDWIVPFARPKGQEGGRERGSKVTEKGFPGTRGGALLLRHLGCPLEAHIVLRMCDFNVLLWVRGKFDLALLSAKEHGL